MSYNTNEEAVSVVAPVIILVLFLSLSSCNSGGSGDSNLLDNGQFGNAAPVANAGPDQAVTSGTLVTLSGGSSSDPDDDVLTFMWSFTSKPAGSSASFPSSFAISPTFIADVAGTYQIQLIVNDGQVNSLTDTVTVTATAIAGNTAPFANAGPDQTTKTGATVTMDGSGSIDVDGDPITYSWSFTSRPAGSSAALTNSSTISPTFTADKAGTYQIQLVVNDGQANSAPDNVMVFAATPVLAYVPDTGQTTDYTSTSGEDSDYTIHPPSYTVNADGTVMDNVTGLMWQQQDDGTARCSAISFVSQNRRSRGVLF